MFLCTGCFDVENNPWLHAKNFLLLVDMHVSMTLPEASLDAVHAEIQKYVHGVHNI
jgi:hypothetical protein